MVRFVCVQKLYVPNGRTAEAGSAQARKGRMAVHSLQALVADIAILAKNDVSLGDFGIFTVVAASMPGRNMPFKLQGIVSEEMFPASARQESANCLPVNRKLWIL